jgi:DNA-binding GntR family transcriptional regulator
MLDRANPLVLGENTGMAVARRLQEAIVSGELAPGTRLGEQTLARQFGVSRTPIREALLLLRNERLIDMPPNRPALVRNFTADDLHEMHSLRAVLEGYAARTAAAKLTEAGLARLAESTERYGRLREEDEDLPRLVAENMAFHETIIDAAASERLASMIRQVTVLPLIYRSYMTYSRDNRDTAWRHHQQILAALRDRDPDAAEIAMKAHVLWARDVALAHLPFVADGRTPAAESA